MPDIADLGKYMQAAHVELLRRSREIAAGQTVVAPVAKAAAKPVVKRVAVPAKGKPKISVKTAKPKPKK